MVKSIWQKESEKGIEIDKFGIELDLHNCFVELMLNWN